jgi:hypothetical protein
MRGRTGGDDPVPQHLESAGSSGLPRTGHAPMHGGWQWLSSSAALRSLRWTKRHCSHRPNPIRSSCLPRAGRWTGRDPGWSRQTQPPRRPDTGRVRSEQNTVSGRRSARLGPAGLEGKRHEAMKLMAWVALAEVESLIRQYTVHAILARNGSGGAAVPNSSCRTWSCPVRLFGGSLRMET